MKKFGATFITVAIATLSGCSSDPGTSDPTDTTMTGTAAEAVTLVDCQKQVAACTLAAKSLADLGQCTAQFEACSTQAATDLVGHGTLLSDCRASANKCLAGALTSLDVSKCRGLFDSCAKDVEATANGALGAAIGTAKTAIAKTTQAAINAISAAGGAVDGALTAVDDCSKQATQCLGGATIIADVTDCEKAAQACANNAVTLVNKITDPLPGPNPGQLAGGLSQCQTEVTGCLAKAVTTADVSACKGALQLCVKNTTGFVDQTINDLTGLIPGILGFPVPQPVDCASQAAQCLLNLSNPLDCATQATTCLTK